MTFRTRVFLGSLAAAGVPVLLIGGLLGREAVQRLEEGARLRVGERLGQVAATVRAAERDLAARVGAIAARAQRDDRLRLAVMSARPGADPWLTDWAASVMDLAGLSMLQLQDSAGTILSSGHFRSDFGRIDSRLLRALDGVGEGAALVEVATERGRAPVLVTSRTVTLGRRTLRITGGIPMPTVGSESGTDALSVELVEGVRDPPAEGVEMRAIAIPRIPMGTDPGDPVLDSVRLEVRHSLDEVARLRRRSAAAVGLGLLLALVLAAGLSRSLAARVSAPLETLARRASTVDLERLDVRFDTRGDDEVAQLSRVLDGMVRRLGESAARVRRAERRAALGDMARQVTHDVKNAVAPIRNVIRHLEQVDGTGSSALQQAFRERRGTLSAGVAYLADLAERYARLAPRSTRVVFPVGEVVEAVVRGRGDPVSLTTRVEDGDVALCGDPLALRRVLENLVGNALDAAGEHGHVRLSVRREDPGPDAAPGAVTITVEDDGPGMTEAELARAQEDFYTSKDGGTGLGLSIVRRLVADLEGSLTLESRPGRGTVVTLRFPEPR